MNAKKNSIIKMLIPLFWALIIFTPQTTVADDTEVFDNPGTVGSRPNVLFVFDTSGSMNEPSPSDSSKTKQESLQEAVETVLNSSGMDINAGYLNFGDSRGRGVKFPVSNISGDANLIDSNIPTGTSVREVLINMVNADGVSGATPTVDALYEAARYFRGESPVWGNSGTFGTWSTSASPPHYTSGNWKAANPATYTGGSSTTYTYMPWSTPTGGTVKKRSCDDKSASGGSNGCAFIPSAFQNSTYLNCTTVPAVPCTNKPSCPGGWSYSKPASCINGPGSSGSDWLFNSGRKCCTSADPTNTECLGSIWLPKSCASPGPSSCTGGKSAYSKCEYKRDEVNTNTRKYQSPISQCGANMIVLLSDGAPSVNNTDRGQINGSGNTTGTNRIRTLIANGSNAVKIDPNDPNISRHDVACEDLSNSVFQQTQGSYLHGNCGPELAGFLSTKDQIPGVAGSNVNTYTIGFGLTGLGATESQNYLRKIAEEGNGFFGDADSTASLVTALENAINAESSGPRSFTGLVTSIDQTSLSHAEEVYLSVFKPAKTRAWDGNIKGYTIDVDGLEGLDGNAAVNSEGEIQSGVRSHWSTIADGANVTAGGFVGKLDPATRNIYVNTTATIPSGGISLTTSEMESTNTALTKALMGMPGSATNTERSDLIDWARSQRIHDPLHAKPVIVDYGGTTGKVLFSATNQGYLHAIDVNDKDYGGDEIFAFMPYHLIGNLQAMQTNSETGAHIYGIDGYLSTWINDANKDGEISGIGEHAYLYFGLRRGGDHFYALDVTDPTAPELMWRIDAGSSNFEHLGQSWSRMSVLNMNDDGTARKVLAFSGGYDVAEDTVNTARAATYEGLGVYLVDAVTGQFLASIGPNTTDYTAAHSQLIYSIPSGVKAIDSNRNGIADRLYFGDMGGQVWRVDITEAADLTVSSTYAVTRLADLGGSTTATHRRFFYPPSISKIKRHNDSNALTVSIGSGYRAHPLNKTINDNFYSIFDPNIGIGAPSSWTTLTESSLYDVTNNLIGQGNSTETATAMASLGSASGWRFSLGSNGEKVLASAKTIGGEIFFTTYQPSVSSCDSGTNRLYRMKLIDATPTVDLNSDGTYDTDDRVEELKQGGIAPEFKRIYLPTPAEGGTQDCVGVECKDGPPRQLKNIFWREER